MLVCPGAFRQKRLDSCGDERYNWNTTWCAHLASNARRAAVKESAGSALPSASRRAFFVL
jgi:hypothetical protein